MKKIYFLLFALFYINLSAQDCKLFELDFKKLDCDSNKYFQVKIDFEYKNTSSCFKIHGNGVDYGSFEYSKLPIILDSLKGDCSKEYEFVITDCEHPDCRLVKELGKVCCETKPDCKISELQFEKTTCDADKNFYVFLKFKYQGNSECFRVKGNDHTYGEFKYTDLPIKLGPFKGDCTTNYEFVVIDCANEHCNASINVGKVCCDIKPDCKISEMRFEKSKCDSNKNFYVYLNFDYKGNSECFRVKGNGNSYGEYKYANLPIKLGPFKGDCTTNYEFVVIDCANEHCNNSINVGKVCCDTKPDCKISELQFEKTTCDADKNFYVFLKFKYQGNSECFRVKGNGHTYGEFKYANLPIKLGPFKGDCTTNYEFVVIDCANEHCNASINVGKVCCDTKPDCKISELQFEKTTCDADKNFYVFLKFKYQGNGECFRVKGNGHTYGEFKYTSLPIKLGPFKGDCTTNYEFVVIDCANEHCNASINVGKVCCDTKPDCKISELQFEKTTCDADKNFYVFLKFKYQGNSECFRVKGNGHTYGEFKYTSLPIKLGPFKGDCTTNYEFVVIDCANEHCNASINVGKVCCDTKQDCKISEMRFDKSVCDSNKNFYVYLNFDYKGNSECFRVKGNGHSYGEFKYANLPIKLGPFKGDCTTNYEFVVIDCANEHCNNSVNVGKVCCENGFLLSELGIKKSECDSAKHVYLTIDFDHKNTSDSFYLLIPNLVNSKLFSYNQLPIKLGPFEANCNQSFEILVKDYLKHDCKISKNIGKLCCEGSNAECKITELKIIPLDCTGPGQYSIKINFNHTGTKGLGFDVWSRSTYLGFFNYNVLPLTILDFKTSGKDFDHIKVCENDREDCCASIEFAALKCFGEHEFDLNQIKVYQENGRLIISSPAKIPALVKYQLYFLQGQILVPSQCISTDFEKSMNANNFENGIYILRFEYGNQSKDIKFVLIK
jgi:hypothetical protein